MPSFKINLNGTEIEIQQDVDGKFIKPQFLVDLEPYGSALKPANEPIVVARKPLEKGLTIAENVVKWGAGALNIDVSRVGVGELVPGGGKSKRGEEHGSVYGNGQSLENAQPHTQGRWPANVLLDEEAAAALDLQTQHLHGAGSKRSGGKSKQDQDGGLFGVGQHEGNGMRFGDSGGASRFFKTFESELCQNNVSIVKTTSNQLSPLADSVQSLAAILEALGDESSKDTLLPFILETLNELSQSDEINIETTLTTGRRLKRELLHIGMSSRSLVSHAEIQKQIDTITTILNHLMSAFSADLATFKTTSQNLELGAKVCASRFAYVAKASTRERNVGMGEGVNLHPTIKPVKLMEYLIALVTPPNGTCLDPFMGSGSTGVAAKNLDRPFVGVEMSPEYFEIAKKRIG